MPLLCSADRLIQLISAVSIGDEEFVALRALESSDSTAFSVLVSVVLSQNTSDRNAVRAFTRLRSMVGLSPREILDAGLERVAEAVKPAGMHRQRAARLIELARIVLDKYGGSLDFVCSMSVEEARQLLMELPGVGPKTADVVLLAYCGLPTFPVDTHISRICSRLGLGSSYEVIRRWFLEHAPHDKLYELHLKLIVIGRRYCRPRNPRCNECPLRECCSYAEAHTTSHSSTLVP